MSKLKYSSSVREFEGVIVEVTEGSITIDIAGRMGRLKIPLRMLISENPPEVGQIVGFLMSCPEILNEEMNK